MAKGKDSSALFEVINRSRPLHQQVRPGFFGAIASWFRSRPADGAAAPVYRETMPAVAAPAPPIEGAFVLSTPTLAPPAAATTSPGQPRICLDRGRHEIGLRISYMGAIVAVMAMMTVVAIAFMAGQKAARPKPALTDGSIDQMRKKPAQANVASLGGQKPPEGEAATGGTSGAGSSGAGAGAVAGQTAGAAAGVRDRNRTVNLNYVIIQSYPEQEKKMAEDAMSFLVQNGIDCTLEKGLQSTNSTWYSLVGTTGFGKTFTGSQEYQAYLRKIKDISDKYAGGRRSFKAFAPYAYKWKG